MTGDAGLDRGELVEAEAGGANAVADIGAVKAHVIVLAEMQLPIPFGDGGRILIGFRPALDDRYHHDGEAAGSEDPVHLGERRPIIDMLQDVRADDGVIGRIRQVDPLDVDHHIGPAGRDVGGVIGAGSWMQEARDPGFWREVEQAPTGELLSVPVEPEPQQPMPLERSALRTARFGADRKSSWPEWAVVSAQIAGSFMESVPRDANRMPDVLQSPNHRGAEAPFEKLLDHSIHSLLRQTRRRDDRQHRKSSLSEPRTQLCRSAEPLQDREDDVVHPAALSAERDERSHADDTGLHVLAQQPVADSGLGLVML